MLAVIALAAVAGAQPFALKGTVTLAQVRVASDCKSSRGAQAVVVLCQQAGTFAGRPGVAGAAYSWRWDLRVGKDGKTTGYGTELGELALNFGKRGVLRVTTRGRQAPASPTRSRTTGTWAFKSGTGSLAGGNGSGTYVFETLHRGPNTLQIARIVLTGRIRSAA